MLIKIKDFEAEAARMQERKPLEENKARKEKLSNLRQNLYDIEHTMDDLEDEWRVTKTQIEALEAALKCKQ